MSISWAPALIMGSMVNIMPGTMMGPSPGSVTKLTKGSSNVDCSTILDGYFSDSSRMFCIGEVSPEAADLVRVTKEAVEEGLKAVKPWGHLGDVGAAVNARRRSECRGTPLR